MPKLTENEISTIRAKITRALGRNILDIFVEPNNNESERSFIEFTSADFSSAYKDASALVDYMSEYNSNHVLFIPVGSRAFIVSNDLLRKVFCE